MISASLANLPAEDWAAGFKALQTGGGRFQAQLDYALRWARAEPENPSPWTIVGANSDALGDYQRGADGWHHVVELSPAQIWPLQNLANDYEHLGRPAEAGAIYRKLLTLNHDASLDAGWKHRLSELDLVASTDASVPMSDGLPSGIPEAAGQLIAAIRRKWHRDAVLILVLVRAEGTSLRTEFKFIAPSNNNGLTITVRGSRLSAGDESDPERERTPLPSNLLDLPEAASKARKWGIEGRIIRATLYCRERCSLDGTGAFWSVTVHNIQSDEEETIEVPAFVMSKQDFQTLMTAAKRGEARAQLAVARTYFEGLTGSPDSAEAARWCARAAAAGDPNARRLLEKVREFSDSSADRRNRLTPAPATSGSCAGGFVYSSADHRCVSSAMAISLDFDTAIHPEMAQKP